MIMLAYFAVSVFSYCSDISHALGSDKVKIRSDGTTLINKKPFFPLGLYIGWKSAKEERMRALQDIAKAGFNTIHAGVPDLNDYETFLDEAKRLGVYVISERTGGLPALVNRFKHKPAVLGWDISDDVDDGTNTPEQVDAFNNQIKSSDPNHITYVSGASTKIVHFANCSDVVAMQSYPVRVKPPDLSSTYSTMFLTRQAVAKFNGTAYANLQAFNWAATQRNEDKDARLPNSHELRNMTYQALLAGAKGIIYYAYNDENWYLPTHQHFWESLKSLVPEIQSISPMLLDADFTTIDTGIENIVAGVWTQKNQVLTIVINTSYKNYTEVSINLPIYKLSKVKSLLPINFSSLSFQNGKLSGVIKPLEVYVYENSK